MPQHNGNGHGGIPPEDQDPLGPAPDGDEINPRFEQLLGVIRKVSRSEIDQAIAANNEALLSSIDEKLQSFGQQFAQQQALEFKEAIQVLQEKMGEAQAGSAMEVYRGEDGRIDRGAILAHLVMGFLDDPVKLGESLGSVANGIASMRKSFKPQTDIDQLLRHIKETSPEKLAVYAPNPLGEYFPALYKEILTMGVRTGLQMKQALGGGEVNIAPLVGGSTGPSAPGSAPAGAPPDNSDALAADAVFGNMTDQQMDSLIGKLMRVRVQRQKVQA